MKSEAILSTAGQAAAVFLGQPARTLDFLGKGTANQSFLVTDRSGTVYVLRRRKAKYGQLDFAEFEAQYLHHLAKAALPVPELLPVPGQGVFLQLAGTIWQMSRFIKGQPYAGGPAQIRAAGEFLARLHNAALGFVPTQERLYGRHERPLDLKERYRAITSSLQLTEAALMPSRWIADLIERLCTSISDQVFASLPKLHIHGDYHCFNLLFLDDQVSGVFDFDQASWQARLRDLADGVIFFGSGRQEPIDDSDIISLTQDFWPVPALSQTFLQGYQARADLPISEQEKRLLPDFIAARFLGMRFDGLEKLPWHKRSYMLEEDYEELLGWLQDESTIFSS